MIPLFALIVAFLPATTTFVCAGKVPRHLQSANGIIPFGDFDAGNHSYSLGFIIHHKDDSKYYTDGRPNNPPQRLYQDIRARCSYLGSITDLATQDTSQLLVMTKHHSQGVDFIYTDEIDY
jgi:hypothetical protein